MADLSSILGGMVQGFKDFGTGLVDMFGTGGAAIGDAIASIQSGRATTKNQDDFRKWLYNTDSTKDAAAKGLGTALNGVSTVADVIPGAQAVTANPLFNGIQGAIGGVADELKMAGENADLGRAAQRAGVGAASGLASGYAGQALGKSGNKLLSNGLTRGAVSGALGGGIANAGYTGIEGGSVQDMINAGLYGAQTGALVGGTTGLARELIRPAHKMDAKLTDAERQARIANIDDQLGKLDLSTPEGNARYNELEQARNNYSRQAQFDLLQKTNPMTDDYHTGIRSPEDIRTLKSIVDGYNEDNNFTYPDFTLLDAQKALANGNIDVYSSKPIEAGAFISPSKMMATDYAGGGEVYTKNIPLDDFAFIESGDEGNYLPVAKKPKTVADLMNEPKQKTVADLMLSPEQKEFFKDSVIRDENGNLKKMYHGSSDGTFTKFKEGSFFTDDKDYADTYQDEYAGMNYAGKKLVNPKTYEVYLDVKKPFSMADPEARRIIENEYVGRDKNYWVTDPSDTTEVDFTEADNLRAWLKKNHPEYDGMYVNEGGGDDPFAEEGWEEWRGNSVVPFNANQIKDVNNLKPTADADIMYSKVAEGQTSAASSSDGKYKRIGSADVAPINPETLPDSLRMANEYINEGYIKDIEKTMGKPYSKMTDNDFLEYSLRNKKPEDREFFKQIINDMVKDGSTTYEKYAKSAASNKYLRNLADTKLTDMDSDSLMRYLINNKNKLTDNFTKAADAELSDRLGIGRSNTLMMDDSIGTENAYGVYNPTNSTMSLNTRSLGEGDAKTSVAGHERLHSFQTEARIKRYSPEVVDAYKNLRKELRAANAFKNKQEIKDYWGEDISYYHNNDEQEARMFQQYLEKKGFTDRAPKSSNKVYHEKNVREFDNSKITPAFDKFLDKLRALSKKGVALPALTALFGGGAIMAATQNNDKKKKSEVK